MKIRKIFYFVAILLVFAIFQLTLVAKGKPKTDIGAFAKELLQMKIGSDYTQMAMWLPFEFFVEANIEEGGASRSTVEKEMKFFKSYNILIVQCSIDQPDGSSLYSSEKEVRARAVLELSNGTEIVSLEKVPPMVSVTVDAIKQVMASEGDIGGANMHILVFPSKDNNGRLIVNTVKKDKLTFVLKADEKFKKTIFTWYTPFDALTAVPSCSYCGRYLSAKWSFCPWCGKKLSK